MTNENNKKVVSNAMEVYIWLLRGESAEFALKQRPYKESKNEEEIATDLSVDR